MGAPSQRLPHRVENVVTSFHAGERALEGAHDCPRLKSVRSGPWFGWMR
jgi:hypothetical protein